METVLKILVVAALCLTTVENYQLKRINAEIIEATEIISQQLKMDLNALSKLIRENQRLQDNLAICKIIKQESVILPPKVGE